jgi:hypothetical protein
MEEMLRFAIKRRNWYYHTIRKAKETIAVLELNHAAQDSIDRYKAELAKYQHTYDKYVKVIDFINDLNS